MVGFQGEPGAFSEEAAIALLGEVETRGYRTFDALVEAVVRGEIACGLLPCENTIAGSIARAYDLLYANAVHVVDETTHRIEQALIGVAGAPLDAIETISSHPVALDQCRRFLAAHPHATPVAVEDTAGAVRAVAERADERHAAIGPPLAARRYGASVLLPSVADEPENFTRFFLVARDPGARRRGGRASISFVAPHEPGSLRAALGEIEDRGMNLRSLVARPRGGNRPFEYVFHADIEASGAEDVAVLAACLGPEARVLGWY